MTEYGHTPDGRPIDKALIDEMKARIPVDHPLRFEVHREPDDETGICRASIGGDINLGFYLNFRGDPKKVEEMLQRVLDAFEKVNDA